MDSKNESYLVGLRSKIWQTVEGNDLRLGSFKSLQVKRPLTAKELDRVAEIFRSEPDLIFEPGSGRYGFGVAVTAYKPGELAGYVHQDPVALIRIDSKHINKEDNASTRNIAYRWIEQFTHTDKNRERRRQEGFKGTLEPMSYYDY